MTKIIRRWNQYSCTISIKNKVTRSWTNIIIHFIYWGKQTYDILMKTYGDLKHNINKILTIYENLKVLKR